MPGSKRRVSYKDLQILFLTNGVAAIEQLLAEGAASAAAVRKALAALQEQGGPVAALQEFVTSSLGQGGKRGRSAPDAGQERTYRAQQLAQGSPFLRLPLQALKVAKGGSVTVRFEGDRIIVTNR